VTGRVLFANAAVRRFARTDPEGTGVEEVSAIWGETLDREGRPIPPDRWPVRRALLGERGAAVEFRRPTPDGRERVLLNAATPILAPDGRLLGAVSVSTEITDLTRREVELRSALADKETLLQEVHHRTKNSLQMLATLLELQADAIRSPEGKAALEASGQRIYTIARLYEQLYQSMATGAVRLAPYLRRLAEGFRDTAKDTHNVDLTFHLPEGTLALDVGRAIPCGLIVNELLTNAVKHAFSARGTGEIGIELHEGADEIELRVWDDGVGLPPGMDLQHASTLGLRLIRILAQRLSARVAIENRPGARVTLTFPRHAEVPVEPP
jgi:two-component sensor histidine kinase